MSEKWGIDITNRIMKYQPWKVDRNYEYVEPTSIEIQKTYGINSSTIIEVYNAFIQDGGDYKALIGLLNSHAFNSKFILTHETILNNYRWYTNEFYFYLIMFTKTIIGDYDWCYKSDDYSSFHKIYEIGHLRYIPFGKNIQDVTNTVIVSILCFLENKSIDTSDIFEWFDCLTIHKTKLNYLKDIKKLENCCVCSEFIFFFYEFVKVVSNINDLFDISSSSTKYYYSNFFWVPQRFAPIALKACISNSSSMFNVSTKNSGKSSISIHINRKSSFDMNKMHGYSKSININVNEIISGVHTKILARLLNLKNLPRIIYMSSSSNSDFSYTLCWKEKKSNYLRSCAIAFNMLVLPLYFINWGDINYLKIALLSFSVPFTFFLLLLNEFYKNRRKNSRLREIFIRSRTLYQKQLKSIQKLSKKLIDEKQNLEKKITLRTLELEDANVKLKQIDKIKSNFFDNFSHELKTPITLISAPLESIIKQHYGTKIDYSNNVFSVMLSNCNRLINLMNMLLDYSKIENGKMKLQKSYINIQDFIERQIKLFDHSTKNSSISISFKSKLNKDRFLYLDTSLFEIVFANIFSNAFKFSRESDEVEIDLVYIEKSNSISVSIKDSGIGIPKNKLDLIFERYYQVNNGSQKQHDGVGLGLSLTKKIIELHGGIIKVNSQLDVGTTFIIELPISDVNGLKVTDNSIIDDNSFAVPYLDEQSNEHNKTFGKTKILLVEDNIDLSDFLESILSQKYCIRSAANGYKALSMLENYKPDLIISDIMMPEMDGMQFIEKIKANNITKSIPFIFLTARDTQEENIKGLDCGAIDYITKPFKIQMLISKIDSIIEYNENRDQFTKEKIKQNFGYAIDEIFECKREITYKPISKELFDLYNITDRESEIIELILDGKQTKEIAYELNIALPTVSKHISNIYEKTNISNRLELVNIFRIKKVTKTI